MRIAGLLALASAFLVGVRGPAATLASCAAPAASHACCAGMPEAAAATSAEPGACPSEGAMPCCRLTKPAPASPSVLTAAGTVLTLSANAAEPPPALAPALAAPSAPPRALARSSPPVSILRI